VFIVAGAKAGRWLTDFDRACHLDWEPKDTRTPQRDSFRFAADAIVARCFSPLTDDCTPVVLTAEQLYFSALRDGVLLMQLQPGQTVAAPGFSMVQFKPCLLLMSLACGATWAEVEMQELADGRALLEGQIQILGVTSQVRSALQANPMLRKAKIQRWFRNAAEEGEIREWTSFAEVLAPLGVLGMNYFANTAAGGGILFSPWSSNPIGAGVLRTPGLPCHLCEPNGTSMPPLADVALIAPKKFPKGAPGIQVGLPEAAVGRIVIVRTSEIDILVKNLGSHRSGAVLPELQIEQALKEAFPDQVRAAVLVSLPVHGDSSRTRVALLVFVRPGATVKRTDEFMALLQSEFGQERTPDRVEVFEMNPKLVQPKSAKPQVDRAACRAQYTSGVLWGKNGYRVFRELSALFVEAMQVRRHLAPQSAGEP
jgi:hypothetical protein